MKQLIFFSIKNINKETKKRKNKNKKNKNTLNLTDESNLLQHPSLVQHRHPVGKPKLRKIHSLMEKMKRHIVSFHSPQLIKKLVGFCQVCSKKKKKKKNSI